MKRVNFYFLFLVFVGMTWFSCHPAEERKAISLVEKSIAAHGGQSEWDVLEAIHFSKKTSLFAEDGSLEEELDQQIEFQLKPQYSGKMSWIKDSIAHVLEFDGKKIRYKMAGNQIQNSDFLASKKKELDAALYVVGMPWKLLEDQSAKLIYKGIRDTALGEVEVIEVDYGPGADRWWYYFDAESHLMVGNEVQLEDHRSVIENLDFNQVDDFVFYGERKSYRVDSLGQKLYLRAAYQYGDYKLIP
ncbi:hypothetical protein [Algoriphagus hitonicola]|uniref:Lipoprotein n=1 Tax=Algoriphagus hitonicola TaxID=435880 RepID=A0A1I2TJR5_9BACT|nr:hypothetical protein [Algoriphagus hitonicola]SFG65063.1 hypothetical protein SAMN04487988_10669 [Algoriphagus hitonicola]